MTIKNGDLPAMPVHQVWQDCGIDGNSGPHYVETIDKCLTKREQFAMAAMQGLLVNAERNSLSFDTAHVQAVKCADNLLAELERTK